MFFREPLPTLPVKDIPKLALRIWQQNQNEVSMILFAFFFLQEALIIYNTKSLAKYLKAVEELKNNVTEDIKMSLEEKSRDVCAKWEVRTCICLCTYVFICLVLGCRLSEPFLGFSCLRCITGGLVPAGCSPRVHTEFHSGIGLAFGGRQTWIQQL